MDNGDWLPIQFDENNVCDEYGLSLEEDLTQGITKLVAVGLTSNSFGTYKCTAIGENGTEQSATVELKQSDDDLLSNYPFPQPSPYSIYQPTPSPTYPQNEVSEGPEDNDNSEMYYPEHGAGTSPVTPEIGGPRHRG